MATTVNKDTYYSITIGIGSPSVNYTMVVDTGSANFWIGLKNNYIQTSSSKTTNYPFKVSYAGNAVSTYASGVEYIDTITLFPSLVVENQTIGVATTTSGFNSLSGYDGVLGVGPNILSYSTVGNLSTVSTILDNICNQLNTSNEVMTFYLIPSSTSVSEGTINFCKNYTGPAIYSPFSTVYPSSDYYSLSAGFTYGNVNLLSSGSGIVDEGVSFTLLATDILKTYVSLTGAEYDSNSGLYYVTSEQYSKLQTMYLVVSGVKLQITPNAQVIPVAISSIFGGTMTGVHYLTIGDIGTPSGQGMDFSLGYFFMQRYFTIFDLTNRKVGFAATPYTTSIV